jgi:hypothetical protein
MRAIILHHPRHTTRGRRRARPRARLFHRRASGPTAAATATTAAAPTDGVDAVSQRVRAAGGPTDEACYTCACGYVFSAAVSTTVTCPRCHRDQAW